MKKEGFEPRIIGFLCRWCAYPGADLAGTSRIKYPPNLISVRVMSFWGATSLPTSLANEIAPHR